MLAGSLSETEQKVMEILEEREMRNISVGNFDFIQTDAIAQEVGLSVEELNAILESLKTKRLVLWDKQAGVKTRIGHIIRCLYYSRAISRAASMRNVADVKYIRYVKQIPRNNNLLTNDTFIRKIDEIIGFLSLEEKSSKIVTTALSALSAVFTEGISDFQVKSTLDILHALKSGSLSNGIVIVADTGAGKSFGYQLPLILWILAKKIRAYLQNVKKVNCSAILVFPRNVLAADQLEDLRSLTSRIEDAFSRLSLPIPTEFTEFLRFRISKDFGRIARPDREKIYTGNPDIIVTNTETLKRRMLDPLAHKIYRKGIDMVLYDEIHLYSGIHGAYVTGLNARLKAILPNQPVFVGMSATIANPEKHCQKLFALKSRPALVSDKDDVLTRKAIEHHVILKPRAGRPALGVAIDTTSCLIHNRRDGMAIRDTMLDSERPKTICFSDSLDITGRWTREQDDLELAYPTLQPPTRRFHRGYPFHFAPAQETMGNSCNKCKSGKDIIASLCSFYREGLCWYFSGDSGEPNMWRIEVGQSFVPLDNLRSKRLTSQEVNMEKMKNVYDLFRRDIHDGFGNTASIKVDNLIATGVLEVGVDFMGIKEIIMYGEVKSPANYKQKAGRGAREGNITDGLFVMSVVPSMPLANFYYRHFYRLVNPTLNPIPLEPANPNAMKAHAFAAVFDFLAKKDIDIFNVIDIKEDEQGVEAEFARALGMLKTDSEGLKNHILKMLELLGYPSPEIVDAALDTATKMMEWLLQDIEYSDERKKLITWVFNSSREPTLLSGLEKHFESLYQNESNMLLQLGEVDKDISETMEQLITKLKSLGTEYEETAKKLQSINLSGGKQAEGS